MKRIKNYITPDHAKKKVARYMYWSIKDESGITITSSEDAQDRSFTEILDKIIADNVDAEVQVKFGVNEASSRQNPPLFIRINETTEWIEPESDDTVSINGVPHKVDKNGNVNINFTTPTNESPVLEASPVDNFRQEMEMQLEGLRKENELQKRQFDSEIHNKLMEQTLKFKEMMLTDRENRLTEREQMLSQQEAQFEARQNEISEDVKGYIKHIPKALGGLVKDWMQLKAENGGLGKTEKPPVKRNKVAFEFEQDQAIEHDDDDIELKGYQPQEENLEDYEVTDPETVETDHTNPINESKPQEDDNIQD